jgi:hypothetical protein
MRDKFEDFKQRVRKKSHNMTWQHGISEQTQERVAGQEPKNKKG